MTIWFYSKSADSSWLSNFSEHPIVLEGIRWPSVEHYYQAQKYAGTEAAERIRRAASAQQARKAGQDRSLSPRPDWDTHKEEVMGRAVRAKFEQHRQLRELLLATGDEELIHQSGSDLFWGRSPEGVGENRLGLILMAVRQALRGRAYTSPPNPPCPQGADGAHRLRWGDGEMIVASAWSIQGGVVTLAGESRSANR